jgi:predicted RNA-binding protein YlqC (UPF0109 family)
MSGREAAIHPARDTEREVREMVKVSVEVYSGSAHFRVGVQPEDAGRVLNLAAGRSLASICRVSFAVGTKGLFTEGRAAREGRRPEKLAA